jgi:two-component system chemotaxis response regulator CheY
MTHLILLLVLLVIAVIAVVVDIRRGRKRSLELSSNSHPEAEQGIASPAPPTEVKQAIVVDDSRAMRANIGRVLEREGYRVAEAGDGREALVRLAELSSSSPAVLAMVDWDLPEMSGLEFVRSVRSNTAYDAVRIVIMTPDTEIERVATLEDDGEYLMKPFTTEALLDKLRSASP